MKIVFYLYGISSSNPKPQYNYKKKKKIRKGPKRDIVQNT